MDDPLLVAVLALTRPQRIPTLQSLGSDAWVTTVEHAPLLQQLEQAVVGSIGSAGGTASGGNDSSRLPFDASAVALRDEIRSRLVAWLGIPYAKRWPLQRTLVAWLRMHQQAVATAKLPHEQAAARERIVQSWPDRITALYDPVEQFTLPSPCPRCGERWALEPVHGDQVDALAVTYRRPTPDTLADVLARCRACRHEWPGRHGLHLLQQETAEAAAACEPAAFDTPHLA